MIIPSPISTAVACGALLALAVCEIAAAGTPGQVVDGHLRLLSLDRRAPAQEEVPAGVHRRHHRKARRGKTCSAKQSSAQYVQQAAATSTSAKHQAVATTAAAASTASASSSSSPSSSAVDVVSDAASALGSITGFQGTNSGIGSWFRTDSSSDSTNGQSWCQTYYKDSWNCFAPSVGTMLGNFGGNYQEAAKAYCGREVQATNPSNGNTLKMYICDGFDDKWVRTPGSVDLTISAFTALYGSFNNDKNTVIKDLQWEFTGGVNEEMTFQHGKYGR